MNLTGKIALVTGGARGIGKGCALELARAGADVAINDLKPTPDSERTIAEITALGRKCVLIDGDAFQQTTCADIAKRTLDAFGRIDILVSNPAFSRRGKFVEYDPKLWEQTLAGTLSGGFYMSQLVSRHMIERGGRGKIVFICSVHSRIPYIQSVAYNAAKSGLKHMAKTIAAELLPHRINVNVIDPGWIDTPGEQATFGTQNIAEAAPKLPWGRLGTPADIGKMASFLCSDDADYITGADMLVDGGWCLRAALPTPLE